MGTSLCMCGADDCPRCNPGCNDVIECETCGKATLAWVAIANNWVYGTCGIYCPDCNDKAGLDDV